MGKVRIAVAGAGLIGLRHIEETVASPNCVLARDRRSGAEGGRGRAEVRRAAVQVAGRVLRQGQARRRRARHAQPDARRAGTRVHRGRRSRASWKSRSAHTLEEGKRLVEAAEKANAQAPRRPPSSAQPDPAQGGRDRAVGRARAAGRRDRQRRVLQARDRGLLRSAVRMAQAAGRRSDPDQHDPRSRQPARADGRDRRGAGVRVERDAQVRGRGHGRHQPAFRQRRARHVPALRHRRVAQELGADVAGEQGVRDVSGRGRVRHHRHARIAGGSDDAPADLRAGRGPLVVQAVQVEQTIPLERADPLARQIEHFGEVIRGEERPLVTGRDGLRTCASSTPSREAARDGRIVEIPLD